MFDALDFSSKNSSTLPNLRSSYVPYIPTRLQHYKHVHLHSGCHTVYLRLLHEWFQQPPTYHSRYCVDRELESETCTPISFGVNQFICAYTHTVQPFARSSNWISMGSLISSTFLGALMRKALRHILPKWWRIVIC